MIAYQQALDLIRQKATCGTAVPVPIAEGLGKVIVHTITAPFAVPSFDNSAMDGFALCGADCVGSLPVTLPVQNVTAAGKKADQLKPGFAMQIMTGAPVPADADTVIPIEEVVVTRDDNGTVLSIAVKAQPKANQHIRREGEDFQKNDLVVEAGTRLTSHHMMALAGFGFATISTYAVPEAIILATGDELHEPSSGTKGEAGIYNSNSPYLLAISREAGLNATYHGIIPDRHDDFVRELEKIMASPSRVPRIIISTGAVSKGDFDFIPRALQTVKAEMVFHRVAIKPGKPILFAILPNGDFFFGLPGNPISTAVGFTFFVMPLVRALLGLPEPQVITAKLADAYQTKPGLRQFLKARLDITATGEAQAVILPGQESFKIKPLMQANGWIVLGEDVNQLEAASTISFVPAAPWGSL